MNYSADAKRMMVGSIGEIKSEVMTRSERISESIRLDHFKYKDDYLEILKRHPQYFFSMRQATPSQDMKEGFDYALSIDKTDIPVRNRKHKYLSYGDFTIRSKSYYGFETEIDKIRKGFGDIYLYAWKTEDESSIHTYMLIDLNEFRNSGLSDQIRMPMSNPDKTQFFHYSISELRKSGCLISLSRYK